MATEQSRKTQDVSLAFGFWHVNFVWWPLGKAEKIQRPNAALKAGSMQLCRDHELRCSFKQSSPSNRGPDFLSGSRFWASCRFHCCVCRRLECSRYSRGSNSQCHQQLLEISDHPMNHHAVIIHQSPPSLKNWLAPRRGEAARPFWGCPAASAEGRRPKSRRPAGGCGRFGLKRFDKGDGCFNHVTTLERLWFIMTEQRFASECLLVIECLPGS